MRRGLTRGVQPRPAFLHRQLLSFLACCTLTSSCVSSCWATPFRQHTAGSAVAAAAAHFASPCRLAVPAAFLIANSNSSRDHGLSQRSSNGRNRTGALARGRPKGITITSWAPHGPLVGNFAPWGSQRLDPPQIRPMALFPPLPLRDVPGSGGPSREALGFGGHLGLVMRAHVGRSHSRLGRPQAHRKALLRSLATQVGGFDCFISRSTWLLPFCFRPHSILMRLFGILSCAPVSFHAIAGISLPDICFLFRCAYMALS